MQSELVEGAREKHCNHDRGIALTRSTFSLRPKNGENPLQLTDLIALHVFSQCPMIPYTFFWVGKEENKKIYIYIQSEFEEK